MSDFLFRGSLPDLDPDVHELTQLEDERQFRRLILIPSESTSPIAVRQALCSPFHNIYAEGYPEEATRRMTEEEIFDYDVSLSRYRRYASPRYYQGVEYANVVEALARRRCAETFAANGYSPDEIFVNVQPLSGAPANNAVYTALVKPGETIMGMDLLHGGHLSHGSPAHRTGKLYDAAHYTINKETEQIDYEEVQALAELHKPKMLIAGFSSYPWQVDWARFREIADSVGAYLIADISHIAGLIAGGAYPSPIGHAHVISSTTHKTLCGPRGAILLTTDRDISRRIDRAVFPGEQGGPHVNIISAMAVAFKLAQTKQFSELQHQIIKNCIAFAKQFEANNFKIPFGGTNTHILNLDMKTIQGQDGTQLSGDQAARILELAGIVVNRNTIPGDRSALHPSGIRLGTPWVTQRGLNEKDMASLADIIIDLLQSTTPYLQTPSRKRSIRAKVKFTTLEKARMDVRDLAVSAGIDFEPTTHGYPHYFYIDDKPSFTEDHAALTIKGDKALEFLNFAISADVEILETGEAKPTSIRIIDKDCSGAITKISENEFSLSIPTNLLSEVAAWLRGLSDGFIQFDEDLLRKIPGPVSIDESDREAESLEKGGPVSSTKPYFIGIQERNGESLPRFTWQEPDSDQIQTTALNQTHRDLGAKMVPFAGWDMPVWYTSVMEEHLAVREAAGLFDVSHMGVYQAEGPFAAIFLDSVCGNDIGGLRVGRSLYTHFLDPNAMVIDDLLVYRRAEDKYLIVVNASNDDKDWTWLNAVRKGQVLVDHRNPDSKAFGRQVTLRNLRDPKEGKDRLVDIALQGPRSLDILLALGADEDTKYRILKLRRTHLCEATLGDFELVVSRTGYTGEEMGFELFVHPDKSVKLWHALLDAGEAFGIKPCGLGARDSLRTEAGLPLYGHEMGGEYNLGVGEAGFGSYIKAYKPWFIGRDAFLSREANRSSRVIRFRFNEKGVRMAHLGDPVVDKRGKTIGMVTSCAVDSEGYLTGQAFLDKKYAKIGTPILIFQNASDKVGKAPAELETGDKVSIPNGATVIPRFLKR